MDYRDFGHARRAGIRKTEAEATAKAYALAQRVIADDVEKSKDVPASISVTCQSA
jgi:hypothetical protein